MTQTEIPLISEEDGPLSIYFFWKTEQLTFLWTLFVMITFGNCSVLAALMFSTRKSRMNFFIKHLAIADLAVGIILVLIDIIWRMNVSFTLGEVLCKAIRFAQCCVTYGSTYVLVSLSIDRYDAITHPLNFTSRARRAKFLITAAWSLSALLSVPQLILSRIELKSGYPQCGIELASTQQWQIYVTLIFISVFLIPAIIISACYSLIVHTIWKESRLMGSSRKRLRQLNGSVDGNRNGKNTDEKLTGFESAENDFKRVSSRGVIPRAKIKTVKMTLVIVFAFIICWTPYFLWDLLQVFQFIPDTETTRPITTFIQSMAPLNSAANPLIYCLFSAHCRNIRRHRLYTWLVDKLCFCIPSNRIVRNGELTTTLTSTFTRSPGQTSVSLQTRSMPINFRNSSFLQVSKSDNFEFSSETDSPIHDMAKYRSYGNSQL